MNKFSKAKTSSKGAKIPKEHDEETVNELK